MNDRSIGDGNDIKGNIQSDTKIKLNIEKNQILNELNANYIADTEKKLTSYFSWLKHLLTLDTVIIVAFSAFAKEFFCPQAACLIFLFAAIVLSFATLFFGSMGLIGETQFYDTEARSVLCDMENQHRSDKPIQTTHHFKVRDEYISYSNKAFISFTATMACIIIYVFCGLFFRVAGNECSCCINVLCIALGVVCSVAACFFAKWKINKLGFDWDKMDIYRRALNLAFDQIEKLRGGNNKK